MSLVFRRGQDISLGETIRDAMSHLVPDSYPREARVELMAALTRTTRPIPDEDPVDYANRLRFIPLPRCITMVHWMASFYGSTPLRDYLLRFAIQYQLPEEEIGLDAI